MVVSKTIVVVTTRAPVLPPPRVMVTAFAVVTVATDVDVLVTAEALAAGAVAVAGDWDMVLPLMRPCEAADRTLDEMRGTAVTGQITVVSTTVSVTSIVESASAGKVERS